MSALRLLKAFFERRTLPPYEEGGVLAVSAKVYASTSTVAMKHRVVEKALLYVPSTRRLDGTAVLMVAAPCDDGDAQFERNGRRYKAVANLSPRISFAGKGPFGPVFPLSGTFGDEKDADGSPSRTASVLTRNGLVVPLWPLKAVRGADGNRYYLYRLTDKGKAHAVVDDSWIKETGHGQGR